MPICHTHLYSDITYHFRLEEFIKKNVVIYLFTVRLYTKFLEKAVRIKARIYFAVCPVKIMAKAPVQHCYIFPLICDTAVTHIDKSAYITILNKDIWKTKISVG